MGTNIQAERKKDGKTKWNTHTLNTYIKLYILYTLNIL